MSGDAVMAPPRLVRIPGWERRLDRVIEAARVRPYVLGTHDCLRVACQSVEALTGADLWPRFAGYRSKREAYATIRRIAPTLGEAVGKVLGVAPTVPRLAQRGDIVRYHDWEDHLGVALGQHVAVLGQLRLAFIPLGHPGLREAWRVG